MAAPMLPLPVLNAADYARGHALFEARSDQRELLTRWLINLVKWRAEKPSRVLSIGCGDGSVDVEVARSLTGLGQPVSYDGVEPHHPSGQLFLERMRQVRTVTARISHETFEAHVAEGRSYDIVLAVHSLYYVPDLQRALRSALDLVAPGGVLVVLHAPSGVLNQLVGVLAPSQGQQFSEAVAAAFTAEHASMRCERLDATLDLASRGDGRDERRVLDFAVQVAIPDRLRPGILDVLSRSALPGAGLRVPHPLDGFIVNA